MIIELTQKQTTIIDDDDADLAAYKWFAHKSTSGKFYAQRSYRKDGKMKYIHIHREVMARILSRELSSGDIVDHIDGNPLNNTRCNLRLCTATENQQNRKTPNKKSSIPYKGVYWEKRYGSWIAKITIDKKQKYLGSFNTMEEAAKAYDNAARLYFGSYAKTNK